MENKHKYLKRFLAFVLSAAMVITYMPTSLIAYAGDGDGEPAAPVAQEQTTEAQPAGKDQAEPQEQAPAETPAADAEQPAPSAQDETPAQTDNKGADSTAAETGEATEDPQATEPENTEDQPEPEPEVGYGEKNFEDSASGVTVKVYAPEGSLPDGTTMKVSRVGLFDMSKVKSAVKEEMGKNAEVVKAVDITFYDKDGTEIQPKKAVSVSFDAPQFADLDKPAVVHIDDNKNVQKLNDTVVDNAGSEVSFDAKKFSIYAVVETGTDARLLVKFMGLNGTEIAHMYVKENDNMEQVLYDPGAGDLDDGVYFRGWTTAQNYTKDTEALTIADVRTAVRGMLPPAKDGNEVTYYAMLFKDYRITYFDENDISLGQEEVTFRADASSAEQSYTVNMGYTVQSDTQHFEGWNVKEGGNNIVGHSQGDIYQNTDEITITGDVKFSVNAPKGHWFIFDENGKGATYNAPQFVYSSAKPVRPDDDKMIRNGYTFGGWFADKEIADQTSGGTPYDFNQTLSDKTTVYARWIPRTTAEYTVIIWRQNVDGDGYDFEEAIRLSGNVGSTINTVTQQGSGSGTYARVNGVNKQYTGFHLREFDQNVTIKTEGNSVLNVYYDRTEYTLQFQVQGYTYTATTSNNGIQYGLVNGQYVQLTRHNSGSMLNPNYYWTYGNNIRYNGTRYTRSNGWETIKTITALYQQNISSNFPIVGTNGVTYNNGERWDPQSSTPFNEVLVFIDVMPAANVMFHLDEATHSTKTITYYIEALPGETPAVTYNNKGFVVYKSIDANYNHFTEAEDYIDLVGFSKGGSTYPPRAYNSNNQLLNSVWKNSSARYVQCFYTRNAYPINFMDGKYVDGDENPLEEASMGQIETETGIAYGADISSHNSYEPDAAHTPSGYVFEGWYIDSACTQPYTFTTMPEGGITVYAKWRQKQYRVFLHPNYPSDASGNIDWGSERQELNFRISEGGHVSEPKGRLNGYEFVGWYLDKACTQVFNGEAYSINENSVTDDYDKTVDMTDTYDNNGNLIDPKSNSDATGYNGGDRFWITKKLDVYAKWRSTLDGASGIVVEYDANGGTGAPTDTNMYVDGALAPAGAASKAVAGSGKQFGYWEVQKWTENGWTGTGTKVFPGGTFEVLAKNAKVEDITPSGDSKDTKKYTVQLKAVYIDSEEPTPTHIYWFKNDGTDAFQKDDNLAINQAVNIESAQERAGYKFLGWAKVNTDADLDEAKAWEANSANWTQELNESNLYLKYDESSKSFKLNDGTTVTQVAADEDDPYQAMFAVWEAQDVSYKVEYYYQNADGTFEIDSTLTDDTRQAKTGSTVKVTDADKQKTKNDQYIFDSENNNNVLTATVNGDGTTTLKVYYKLNKAPVTVHHYLKGTTTKVAEDVTENVTIGTEYTATPVKTYQEKDLTVDSYNPTQTVTVDVDGNEITIYYTLPLTINAATAGKPYDGTALDGSFTFSGELSSDTNTIEKALGTAPSITTVAESREDGYEYQASTTGIPSYYEITNNKGKLTITAREITVSVTDKTAEYNGNTQYGNDTPSFENVVNGQTATIGYTPSSGKLVGTYDNGSYADDLKVVDGQGNDVTDNYTLTTKTPGKLTITDRAQKYEIEVVANSNTGNIYDGTVKSATGFEKLEFEVDGNTYTVSGLTTSDPSSADVCNVANAISGTAVVKDADKNDVTDQFTVKTKNGKLEIKAKDVTVSVSDVVVPYNGSDQSGNTEYAFSGIVEGQNATITYNPSHGKLKNTYDNGSYGEDFKVMSGDKDVTSNYNLTTKTPGKLTITDRDEKYEITVVANSNTGNVYDGTVKSATGFEALTFTVDGNTYTVSGLTTSDPSSADVCELTNAISGTAVVKDADDNDVTSDFTVHTTDGKLEIAAREITVSVADKTTEYNGNTQQGNTDYTFNNVADGQTATIGYTPSSGKLVDTYDNGSYADDLKIVDGQGNDVTSNYSLTTKTAGKLTITDRTQKYEITVVANSNTGNIYDGTVKSATGVETLEFTVEGNTYTVSGLTTSDPSSADVCDVANAISGTAVVKDADKNDVTDQFTVNTTDGKLEITAREITVSVADKTAEYNGSTQQGNTALTFMNVVSGQTATIGYTPSSGKLVGTYDNGSYADDLLIVDTSGKDVTDNYTLTTKTPGKLTITDRTQKYEITVVAKSNTGNVYDGTVKSATGFETLEFEVDGNKYTVEGLETSDPSSKNVCNLVNAISGTAVVKDADGNDVTAQFNVSTADGNLEITKKAVIVKAEDKNKFFGEDDPNLTVEEIVGLVTGDDILDTITRVAGETVGEYTITPIVKGKGTDADNYDITVENGKLTINAASIADNKRFDVSQPEDKKYNGEEQAEPVTVYDKQTKKELVKDTDFELSYSDDVTNVGKVTITVTGKGNYSGTVERTYKIIPRNITLTSATDEKKYDGTPLINHKVTIGGDGLANKDKGMLLFDVTGSQTYVGHSDNTFTYKWADENEDVETGAVETLKSYFAAYAAESKIGKNYVVTKEEGTLTVTDEGVDIDKVTTKKHENRQYKLGETVKFTIKVTNIYDENKDIKVTEQDGVKITSDNEFKDVAPGATVSVTAEYVITEADIIAETFKNTAKVEFSGVDEPYEPKDETKIEESKPHLTITKETTSQPANGDAYEVGETITYKITATNDGNLTIKDVEVKDDLTGDTWTVSSLAPGESESFNAEYVVTEKDAKKGSVTNNATATGKTDDPKHPTPTVEPGSKTVPVVTEAGETSTGVKTGDDTNIPGAVGGFFASLAALFGAIFVRRRRNHYDA